MASKPFLDLWETLLPDFQALVTGLLHDPDRGILVDDEWLLLDNENYRELQLAYQILQPHALTFATYLSSSLPALSDKYILNLLHSATILLKEAERNVNILQYESIGKRWRSVYSYAAFLVAISIIGYIIHSQINGHQESDSESEWSVQDVIYHLDFALIKTGGWPITREIHELLKFVDLRILPLLDKEHGKLIDWKTEVEGWSRKSRSPIREISLKFPGEEVYTPTIPRWIEIYKRQLPIKLLGILDHWPAFDIPIKEGIVNSVDKQNVSNNFSDRKRSRWSSIPYLLSKTINGRRIVPVEIGKTYTDPDLQQKIMTIKEYIHAHLIQDNKSENATGNEEGIFGYLAQHNLLTQIPSLRDDICIPEYINYTIPISTSSPKESNSYDEEEYDDDKEVKTTINAWLGPTDTITPLHTDNYHNIFCQVVGSKYVRLYPPSEREAMDPMGKDEKGVDMANTSSLPVHWVENDTFSPPSSSTSQEGVEIAEAGDKAVPDKEQEIIRWRRFKEARYFEFVASEGDSIFFPGGGIT
ncbi:hypothetical protein TWF694_004719 [Orbilia ellipsospora]|uniref:JmjC domain-containing protein n=1 Tax=Orbilia ellipsospora TaxID=2528407 RepID=A0AAV9WWB0_9PEZI